MKTTDDATLRDALRMVIDPEVGLDVVTMGLIYELSEDDGVVDVRYTLTTPGCPMGGVITAGVVWALRSVPGVTDVRPELVFEPPWDPGMIQEGTL